MPEKFYAGEMKFATTPAMVESFDKYADLIAIITRINLRLPITTDAT